MRLFRMLPDRGVEAISLPAAGGVPLDGVARLVLSGGKACVLLAADGVAVNGIPALPVVVLVERDEIRAGGQKYYLALDEAAAAEFAPRDSKIHCARCKSVLAGELVIFCPSCRSAHHEACWGAYATRCAGCDFEIGGEWRPE